MRRHAGRCGFAVLALAIVGAGIGLGPTWLEREPVAPPEPLPSPAAAVAGGAPVEAALVEVPALSPEAARVPAPSPRAAVQGALRLASGEPLAGFGVSLQRLDAARTSRTPRLFDTGTVPSIQPPLHATTGDDGTFGFADLDAGRYRVWVDVLAETMGDEFVLAVGERRTIDLTVSGVLVQATVFHGEAAMPWARYSVRCDGDDERAGRADALGNLWLCLAPGTYEVRVQSDIWPVAPLGEHTLVVPPGVVRTTWRLTAAGTDLEVLVRDPDGNAASGFVVRLDGVLAANHERAVREFHGTDGRAVFEQIPEGAWQVSIRVAEFVAPPPQELVTRRSMPRERLLFSVTPAGIVPLVLLRPDRTPFRVDPELLPWLRVGDQHLPCVAFVAAEGTALPKQIGYLGVPPGRASLTLADVTNADGIEYLPFEPAPTLTFDVVRGATPPLQVTVMPRAEVDLRGCETGGREDVGARVQVFAGDREVRGRLRLPAQRWLGWLPPGDYRVVVTRPSGAREHALRVDRADVQLRLRP